jgi:hypothetical protein
VPADHEMRWSVSQDRQPQIVGRPGTAVKTRRARLAAPPAPPCCARAAGMNGSDPLPTSIRGLRRVCSHHLADG